MISAKSNPCKDCADRVLYCHDKCDKYQGWVKDRRELMAKISKANAYNKSFAEMNIARKEKYRRAHKSN